MKKDIEWLKEQIERLSYTPKGLDENSSIISKNWVLNFIDQLDEPEVKQLDKKIRELESYNDELIRDNNQLRNAMDNQEVLSQEWIDENKVERIDNLRKMTTSDVVTVEKLKNLLVPKQEKPVIPEWLHKIFSCERDAIQRKYVDPWIVEEVAKTKSYVDNNLKPKPTLFKDEKQCEYVADNYEMIINAIFNGYEVEKEKKYRAIIRDGEYIRSYLCKHGDNVIIGTNDNYIEKCPEVTYLTEQEIKDYDERYWAFAQEVTE